MQIHEVQVFKKKSHHLDPEKGLVLQTQDIVKRSDTSVISFDGVEYEVDDDGTFDVPDEVAAFFIGTPGWYEGPNPFNEAEAEADAAKKPARKAAAKK